MPRGRTWTLEEERLLLSIIEAGGTAHQAARLVGRSYEAVRGFIRSKRQAGEAVSVGRWTPEMRNVLRVLWFEGVPVRAIGRKLGVTGQAVSRQAQKLGLPAREPVRRAPREPVGVMSMIADTKIRQQTICLELAICEAADRHGVMLHGYRVAA